MSDSESYSDKINKKKKEISRVNRADKERAYREERDTHAIEAASKNTEKQRLAAAAKKVTYNLAALSAIKSKPKTKQDLDKLALAKKQTEIHYIDDFMSAIAIISNQSNMYKTTKGVSVITPIIAGNKIPIDQISSKKRLFSTIEYSDKDPETKEITVNSAVHHIGINKVAVQDSKLFLQSSEKTFTNQDETKQIKLIQTMYYDDTDKTISFNLSDNSPSGSSNYNYISKYKITVDTTNNSGYKIVLDPYTTNSAKIINPIKNKYIIIKKLNETAESLNIFKYLNDQDSSLPMAKVTSKLSELQSKLEKISEKKIVKLKSKGKGAQTAAEIMEISIYNSVNMHLENDASLKLHINKLTEWKKEYDKWISDKSLKQPLELHEYKFERKEYGKQFLSKKNANLLTLLAPYDSRIKLIDDETIIKGRESDGRFISTVTSIKTSSDLGKFGVYSPYLVSYILRETPIWNKLTPVTDILALSTDNIEEFTAFINGFKSAGLSLVSLLLQLFEQKHTSDKLFIKFPCEQIYKGSEKLPKFVEHIIMFDPTMSKSNAISILTNAPKLDQPLTDLKFIPLDEPFYGTYENSLVKDFDVLFINPSTDVSSFFSDDNLSLNLIKFNKEQGVEREKATKDEAKDTPIFTVDINDEMSFPSLSATTPPSLSATTPAVPKLVQSAWTKAPSKLTDTYEDADLDIDEDEDAGADANTYLDKDEYYHKYLKYKEKYLALKNYIN